jgi:hypothetical protein
MVEDALWKSLATCVLTQISCEAERFVYWKMGLDNEHGCAGYLRLLNDNTSSSVQYTINTTDSGFGTLNFKEKRLKT